MSPKQRLLAQVPLSQDIGKMLASSHFEIASETALLEFVLNQNRSSDGGSAIASHYELEGAKRFLETLKKIATAQGTPNPNRFGQLDHEMKPPEKK